jgi:hypothetical protein
MADTLHDDVLKMLDEYRAACAVTNSSADILAAVRPWIEAIDANYADVHMAVHGPQHEEPEAKPAEHEPSMQASPPLHPPTQTRPGMPPRPTPPGRP